MMIAIAVSHQLSRTTAYLAAIVLLFAWINVWRAWSGGSGGGGGGGGGGDGGALRRANNVALPASERIGGGGGVGGGGGDGAGSGMSHF